MSLYSIQFRSIFITDITACPDVLELDHRLLLLTKNRLFLNTSSSTLVEA